MFSRPRACKRGRMRIALNARILQAPRTGIGHYVAELVNALRSEPDVDVSLFHGWGWSSALPAAAMPGYSRMTPLLRQIPGAYWHAAGWSRNVLIRGVHKGSIFITSRACGPWPSTARP